MVKDIEDFVRMSKFAGERFDLVQAGGGNASVKTEDGLMLIKASGFSMSEVGPGCGCAEVRCDLLRETVIAESARSEQAPKAEIERSTAVALERAAKAGSLRPSIETFMHSVLGKCVLHTHPLTVTAVAAGGGWRETLGAIFPEALLVDYHTPGIALAVAVFREVEKRGADTSGTPMAVFLQNHGLIVSGAEPGAVIETTDSVSASLESASGITTSGFRAVTEISSYVNETAGAGLICVEAADARLLNIAASRPELLFEPPFCPDTVVYCGPAPLEVSSLGDPAPLESFIGKYGEAPRIIIYRGRIFFMAQSVRAARDMESMLKFHLLVLAGNGEKTNPLPEEEIRYLGGWEAEKHRRNI